MDKCPNCGFPVKSPGAGDEDICPNCAATFGISEGSQAVIYLSSVLVIPIVFLIGLVVGIPPVISVVIGLPVLIIALAIPSRLKVIELARTCRRCGGIISARLFTYCPTCGANLGEPKDSLSDDDHYSSSPSEFLNSTKVEELARCELGKCIVCSLGLKREESLVWCPHCGNPAHREHLIEWLHKNKRCPACAAHLEEKELLRELSRRPNSARIKTVTAKAKSHPDKIQPTRLRNEVDR